MTMYLGTLLQIILIYSTAVYVVHSSWLGDVFVGLDEVTDNREIEPINDGASPSNQNVKPNSVVDITTSIHNQVKNVRKELKTFLQDFVPQDRQDEFKKILNTFAWMLVTGKRKGNTEEILTIFQKQLKKYLNMDGEEEVHGNLKIRNLNENAFKDNEEAEKVTNEQNLRKISSVQLGLQKFKNSFLANPKEQEKIQNLVKKYFVKPHTESGTSPWEPLLKKYIKSMGKDGIRKPWNNLDVLQQYRNLKATKFVPIQADVVNEEKVEKKTMPHYKINPLLGRKERKKEKKLIEEAKNIFTEDEFSKKYKIPMYLSKHQILKSVKKKTKNNRKKNSDKKAKANASEEQSSQAENDVVKPSLVRKKGWNNYKKLTTEDDVISLKDYERAVKDLQWLKKVDENITFSKKLKTETYNWFDVTNNAYKKMKHIKNIFKRKGF